MSMKLRPLGIVKEIINASGLEITYAYEDLVFAEHSLFIVRFNDKNPAVIEIFFNENCEEGVEKELLKKIIKESNLREIKAISSGHFKIKEDAENENLEITFLEESIEKRSN